MTGGLSAAISCPQCGSPFNFREGNSNALCPSCGSALSVAGEAGIRRFFLDEKLDLAKARSAARKFFATSGIDPRVVESLKFERGELCFLPFWSLRALALGWQWLEREVVVREEVVDDNGTRRVVERRGQNEQLFETVASPLDWSSPAFDPSSFGLRGIAVAGAVLPLNVADLAVLKQRGTVFDPVKGAEQVRREALAAARDRCRPDGVIRIRSSVQLCAERLSLISYPVWRLVFTSGERLYPVVVDAVNGRILKGRFPGSGRVRLFAPMAAILLVVYAFSLHRIIGAFAVVGLLVWLHSVRGLSPAVLALFFFGLVERGEDIEHG